MPAAWQHQKQFLNEKGQVESERIEKRRGSGQLPIPGHRGVVGRVGWRASGSEQTRQAEQHGAGNKYQHDRNAD
jgi:hypothetical protein